MNQSNKQENEKILTLVIPEPLDIRLEGLAKKSKTEEEKFKKAEGRTVIIVADIEEITKPSNGDTDITK